MYKTSYIINTVICTVVVVVCMATIYKYKNRSIEQNLDVIESKLAGNWYCSDINSCNDMDIVLSIIQNGNKLEIERNMTSKSGIGSSLIITEAIPLDECNAYCGSINGTFILLGDNLVEIFGRNNRWNIYTKDKYSNQQINGCYRKIKETNE